MNLVYHLQEQLSFKLVRLPEELQKEMILCFVFFTISKDYLTSFFQAQQVHGFFYHLLIWLKQ